MKSNKIYNLSLAAVVAAAAVACEPKIDAPTPSKATLDFSRYVSVGNSLTAGYADGGVYRQSQMYSWPSMVAQQMQAAGGGTFEQPLFSESKPKGSGYLTFNGFTATGSPILVPTSPTDAQLAVVGLGADNRTPLYAKYTVTTAGQMTPNNIGIPGIRLADIKTAGYGLNNPAGFNPYYERLLSSGVPQGLMTYLQYIGQSKPTFFSNWLGNNDVLGFATNGGDLDNNGTTDYFGMTDAGLFSSLYTELLDTLTNGKKRKGVVATVPYVTSIPFFTTVTAAAVIKSAAASAPAGSPTPKLYVRTDAGSREIKSQDLICLTTQSVIGRTNTKADTFMLPVGPGGAIVPVAIPHGFNALNPLTNKEVLDSAEVSEVRKRVDAFNSTIKTKAAEYDLAVFDANPYLERVKSGVAIDGISLNAAFISGGAFSLDGVHLTPRGYALIANQFIGAINAKYGSTLSPVNLSAYPAVAFPK